MHKLLKHVKNPLCNKLFEHTHMRARMNTLIGKTSAVYIDKSMVYLRIDSTVLSTVESIM